MTLHLNHYIALHAYSHIAGTCMPLCSQRQVSVTGLQGRKLLPYQGDGAASSAPSSCTQSKCFQRQSGNIQDGKALVRAFSAGTGYVLGSTSTPTKRSCSACLTCVKAPLRAQGSIMASRGTHEIGAAGRTCLASHTQVTGRANICRTAQTQYL